ncbi:MAG: hypothetical protein ACK5Y2_06355 [Bdellovibrionales bacterium]
MVRSLSGLIIALSVSWAWGQETTTPRGDRRATLNFEDELVEGSTQKPELFYLFQKKNFNYGKLIKLRENFIPETRRTAEDLQRIRGGN